MARRLSSPVFIGRSAELASLQRAADAADGARASLLLLGGEAGVGKSRLLAELIARCRASGWLVLEGATISAGADGLPFEPIVAALRSLIRELGVERVATVAGPSLPDLARLVPELATAADAVPIPLSQAEWLQVRTFEGVLGFLGRLGETAPVLHVVEDLHWADRSTRDLLTFLARNARAERLLMVGSFRTDELHRRHPLAGWLAEVERVPRVERFDLRRFDRTELAELLAGILGAPPPPTLVETIAARSDGNAFFAEELASGLDQAGAGRLPATLREIVLARLSSLSEPSVRLVEVAAVAGREVDHDLLAKVLGASDVEVLAALREAVASHLLIAVSDGADERYRFRHALVQEAVYDDMLPSDRRQLHGAYARAIVSDEGADGSSDAPIQAGRLVELAHHWSAAHEQARALRAAIAAGDASRSGFAFAEAAGMYERAIDLWDLVPAAERPADRDLGGLFDEASAMVALVGDPSRAVALAERAIAELDRGASLERRAAARERLGRAAWLAGDGAMSISALEDAVRLLEDAPPSVAQARVQAGLASNLMLAGRVRESQPIAERAIEIARTVGATEVESHALSTLGVDRASLGAVETAVELLEGSLEIAVALGDPTAIGRAYANLGTVRQMGGDLEGALGTYVAGIEASRRHGNVRTFGAFLAINAAGELILLGRHDEAGVLLDRTEGAGLLPGIATIHFSITRAELRIRIGDLAGARTDLELARAEAASVEDVQFVGDLEGVTAELALETDDPDAALEAIHRGYERIAGGIDPRVLGPLAMFGLRAAADIAVRARARRDEPGGRAAVAAAVALMGRYTTAIATIEEPDRLSKRETVWVEELLRAELARAEGRDDPAGWAAIRPALQARPTPYLEAYVLWRQADATPPSMGPAAAEALAAAHAVAMTIGAPLLAARVEAIARRRRLDLGRASGAAGADAASEEVSAEAPAPADPFGLTAREREILALLAEGYTNRRLAESLFISESTAGVHVSNILGKLGVSSRTEAATLAVRLGLDNAAPPDARPDDPQVRR
jgi:DNA-binding CsgD family transcriptional regulator